MTTISEISGESSTFIHLLDENGGLRGDILELPLCTSTMQLQDICTMQDQLKQEEERQETDILLDNKVPYDFYINGKLIEAKSDLLAAIKSIAIENRDKIEDFIERKRTEPSYDLEQAIEITCLPQEIFRIKPVSRCTSSIPGHEEAITSMVFSPDGKHLASGGGDTNVRTWNLSAQVPDKTLVQHKNHILSLAFSLDNKWLVSADKTGSICVWNYKKGTLAKGPIRAHRNWISQIAFQPLHLRSPSTRFVTCSKDCTAKIYDCVTTKLQYTLSSHNKSVQTVAWSGENIILTGGQDRLINLWNPETGQLINTLKEHSHWVNSISLSSENLLKTGAFDPISQCMYHQPLATDESSQKNLALDRWSKFLKSNPDGEKFVSCSDDFTLNLWSINSTGKKKGKKSICKMTGHQNTVLQVKFSPDTRIIASCALDRSIRLWDGKNGKFLARLTGHVQGVYVICWSPDSRLLLSGSADSTLKLWTMKTKSFHSDLPGHADEVYAIDWSNDGTCAASGGKDKVVKLWRR